MNTVNEIRAAIIAEYSNQRKQDKFSIAWALDNLTAHGHYVLTLEVSKRAELLAKFIELIQDDKNLLTILKFATNKDLLATYNNIINNPVELSENMLKAIALKQYHNEPFFITDMIVYEGEKSEIEAAYNKAKSKLTFAQYCKEHCIEIDEYTEDYNNDYVVYTNDEADEKAAEYIKQSLWAFNASFIVEHSKLPYDAQEMIQTYQSEKCEGANATIEALIDDMDSFISDAIAADGRGHFMTTYDGKECQIDVEIDEYTGEKLTANDEAVKTFYVYRMN